MERKSWQSAVGSWFSAVRLEGICLQRPISVCLVTGYKRMADFKEAIQKLIGLHVSGAGISKAELFTSSKAESNTGCRLGSYSFLIIVLDMHRHDSLHLTC